jgi:predicted amidohydrolase
MRAALVSLDQRWQDNEANFTRGAEFVRGARVHECELVVFPEMTLTGYSLDMAAIGEQPTGSFAFAMFGELAKDVGLTILFGGCPLNPISARPCNQHCLAQPDGISRAVYAKIHPLSFAGETKFRKHAGSSQSRVQDRSNSAYRFATICVSRNSMHRRRRHAMSPWLSPTGRVGEWRTSALCRRRG